MPANWRGRPREAFSWLVLASFSASTQGRPEKFLGSILPDSILGEGLFHVVDDERVHRAFPAFEFETELFLQAGARDL
jgi:hypothetical protein